MERKNRARKLTITGENELADDCLSPTKSTTIPTNTIVRFEEVPDYSVTLYNDDTTGFILFALDDMLPSKGTFKKKNKRSSLESPTPQY